MSEQQDQVRFFARVLGDAWHAHIDNAGHMDLGKFVQLNATFDSARYMIAHAGDVEGFVDNSELLAFARDRAPEGAVCLLDGWGRDALPARAQVKPGEPCALAVLESDATRLHAVLEGVARRRQAEMWLVIGAFYNYPGWRDEGRPVPVLESLLDRFGLARAFLAAAHGETAMVLRVGCS